MLYNLKHIFIKNLEQKRLATFPESPPNYIDIISDAVNTSFNLIDRSDALYHDVEHTCLVTLCGLEIFAGKKLLEGELSASDWLHYTISLLFHDVGYLKNLLIGDNENGQLTNSNGDKFLLTDQSTDAALTPFHVERGQLFIQQREWNSAIDKDLLAKLISFTQFPIPDRSEPEIEISNTFKQINKTFTQLATLVGSADLIGQLADPMYNIKIPRLFYELEETGSAKKMGYHSPGDLRKGYPGFFINFVRPHISEALLYLNVTEEGRAWIANLNYHVFSQSHKATVEKSGISLLSELSEITKSETNELKIIQEILNKVGSYKGWPLAHAYVVQQTENGPTLYSTKLWYENLINSDFQEFKKITEAFIFKPGQGLPGRVFDKKSAQTIYDVTKDANFPRDSLAKELGVRGAFAFPLMVAGDVKYVLEFFSPDPEQLDPSVLELLKYVSNQISKKA